MNKKGEKDMLNDEICKLRDRLNKSIEQGDDYSVTYQLSVELDDLIAKYYEDLKIKDMAKILDEKVPTIKSRLKQGLEKMSRYLKKGGSL